MYTLQRKHKQDIAYLKYDGWATFTSKGPLDLTNCILFTKGEVALNPPVKGQAYQHYGCFPALGRLK